jgi:hypothetical protein
MSLIDDYPTAVQSRYLREILELSGLCKIQTTTLNTGQNIDKILVKANPARIFLAMFMIAPGVAWWTPGPMKTLNQGFPFNPNPNGYVLSYDVWGPIVSAEIHVSSSDAGGDTIMAIETILAR